MASYFLLTVAALGLILRVYSLSFRSDLTQAAQRQSSYRLDVAQTRGAFYDCNGQPLTDLESDTVAAVSPSVEAMEALAQAITGPQRSGVLQQLQEGKPFLCSLEQGPLSAQGVSCFAVTRRYGAHPIAPHLLGYLDGDGRGAAGLEAAYQEQLAAAGEKVSVRYGVDIQNRPLEAVEPEISGSCQPPKAGLVLTLDREIQQLCQTVGEQMLEKGAIVVMDVDSGALRAVVSQPSFDPQAVAKSLEDPEAPLLNRAFSPYSVGSTFKLAVAAAALEQGIPTSTTFSCLGGITVAGRMIYCHYRAGHRDCDMEKALEQSCNPYFIQLGQQVGAGAILAMAENLGFGRGSSFAPGVRSAAGQLPSLENASSPVALANLSFGQGELLATPVQVAAMVSSIANGGCQVTPSLIVGWSADGSLPQETRRAALRIFSEQSAQTLRQLMIQVVEEGSGQNAKPAQGGAGGKTASAQSGQLDEEGNELVHAWFAGFYPAEEPRYAIVVLAEGKESGGTYAAPLFRRIADQIAVLEEEREAESH